MEAAKWEYRTVKFDAKGFLGGVVDTQTLDAQLNQLGEQGWELVSVFDTNMMIHGTTREIVATLKRRRG
jgi:Domain of unknown function (DUF4177)